jgi:protocatechuate 3,4-dioxygenase beta subunit
MPGPDCTATIAGTVLDRAGLAALPGAAVRLQDAGGEASTDAQGRYELRLPLQRREVVLSAGAAGFRPVRTTVAGLECGETRREIVLSLQRAPRLRGLVVDRAGRPVAGADVRISSGDAQASSLSDASGRFELSADAPSGKLEVRSPDHAPWSLHMQFPAAPDARELRIELEPAAWLGGRITDARGAPIAGADVHGLAGWGFEAGAKSVSSAADGSYLLGPLPRDQIYRIAIRHPQYAPHVTEEIWLGLDAVRQERDIVLSQGGSIAGIVLTEDGLPAADVPVAITFVSGKDRWQGPASHRPRVMTGMDGTFRIELVPAGLYGVSVVKPSGRFWPHQNVEVLEGAVADVELRVPWELSVRGRLLDAGGLPLPGVEVAAVPERFFQELSDMPQRFSMLARSERAVTDALGAYQLAVPAPGGYWIWTRPSQVMTEPWYVEPPAEDIDLIVLGGAWLEGKVLGMPEARPLLELELSLYMVAEDGSVVWSETRPFHAPDGAFRLPAPAGRELQLEVRSPGRIPVTLRGLRAEVGKAARPLSVGLQRAASVSGIVLDERGKPVAGAAVRVWSDEVQDVWDLSDRNVLLYTDAQGRFAASGLLPGRTLLTATRRGLAPGRVLVELEGSRKSERVEIRLTDGLRLGGRVVRAGTGEPVAGARVELDRGTMVLATDAQGRFELRGLFPGRYSLTVHGSGPQGKEQSVRHQIELERSVDGLELEIAP